MKDYMKVIITALLTAIVTITVTGAFNYPSKIKDEIILVEKRSNLYTDKSINSHELKELERYKRLEDKMDFMLKYLDQRFNDLDKRLN